MGELKVDKKTAKIEMKKVQVKGHTEKSSTPLNTEAEKLGVGKSKHMPAQRPGKFGKILDVIDRISDAFN